MSSVLASPVHLSISQHWPEIGVLLPPCFGRHRTSLQDVLVCMYVLIPGAQKRIESQQGERGEQKKQGKRKKIQRLGLVQSVALSGVP